MRQQRLLAEATTPNRSNLLKEHTDNNNRSNNKKTLAPLLTRAVDDVEHRMVNLEPCLQHLAAFAAHRLNAGVPVEVPVVTLAPPVVPEDGGVATALGQRYGRKQEGGSGEQQVGGRLHQDVVVVVVVLLLLRLRLRDQETKA